MPSGGLWSLNGPREGNDGFSWLYLSLSPREASSYWELTLSPSLTAGPAGEPPASRGHSKPCSPLRAGAGPAPPGELGGPVCPAQGPPPVQSDTLDLGLTAFCHPSPALSDQQTDQLPATARRSPCPAPSQVHAPFSLTHSQAPAGLPVPSLGSTNACDEGPVNRAASERTPVRRAAWPPDSEALGPEASCWTSPHG